MKEIIPIQTFEINQDEDYDITSLVATIIINEDNFETLKYNKLLLDGTILNLEETDKYIVLKLAQIIDVDDVKICQDVFPYRNDPCKVDVNNGMRIDGRVERCNITTKEEIAKEIL